MAVDHGGEFLGCVGVTEGQGIRRHQRLGGSRGNLEVLKRGSDKHDDVVADGCAERQEIFFGERGDEFVDDAGAEHFIEFLAVFGGFLGDFRAGNLVSHEFLTGHFGFDRFDHFAEHAEAGDHAGDLFGGGRAGGGAGPERDIQRRHFHPLEQSHAGFRVGEQILEQLRAVLLTHRFLPLGEITVFGGGRKRLGQRAHLEITHPPRGRQQVGRLLASRFAQRHREFGA